MEQSTSAFLDEHIIKVHEDDEPYDDEECSSRSSSSSSSAMGWPLARKDSFTSTKSISSSNATCSSWDDVSKNKDSSWDVKRDKRETSPSEVELMKERLAKLLLGEDMSGGSRGVCSALTISNAITNLAASVFGGLWRLEPLSDKRKAMWNREMEWLLSVSDYIVELVPSWQSFRDGRNLEIMVSKPRSDIQINLPALRKLDTMLLESLDSFQETEFWYVERGILLSEAEKDARKSSFQRQEDKWWLPAPRVPTNGLSSSARKALQNQRDSTSQILKAAMAINSQVLSEMEVPDLFWETLPKKGKACLGETLYRGLTAENFNPDVLLQQLDLSTEHSAGEAVNKVEAAIHIWKRKLKQHKQKQQPPQQPQPQQQQQQQQHHQYQQLQQEPQGSGKNHQKLSWGKVKDHLVTEVDRLTLVGRAESLLLCLKQRYPGLPQTALDMNKIQYNRDVGQSILESYSRVLESLAFSILARIDDVLFIDDSTSKDQLQQQQQPCSPRSPVVVGPSGSSVTTRRLHSSTLPGTTPYATPNCSPVRSDPELPSPAKAAAFTHRNFEISRKLMSPRSRD